MMGTSVIHDVAQDQIVLLGDSITQIMSKQTFRFTSVAFVVASSSGGNGTETSDGKSLSKWVKPVVRSILAATLPGTGAATVLWNMAHLNNLNEIISTILTATPNARVMLRSGDEVGLPWEQRDASVAFLDLFTTLLGEDNCDTSGVGKDHSDWAERV
ncbi:hypothetical protein BJ742DRAFT_864492 [Cladochytrium replicatum]|nr:hypothetical protein BJ742DRAFT_864492 [Cladochytrium replicatum]